MFRVTTRPWYTVRRSIRTRLLPIRRPGITPRVWRFHLVLGSRWERPGAEDGATTTTGAAATKISTSITTIHSKTTPTARTTSRTGRATEIVAGSTIHNTVEALPI